MCQLTNPRGSAGKGSSPATLKKFSPPSLKYQRKEKLESAGRISSSSINLHVPQSTRALQSVPRNSQRSCSNSSIMPSNPKFPNVSCANTNRTRIPKFLALFKTDIAFSSEESKFLFMAESFGLRVATLLAAKCGWPIRKPLRELLSSWNELGRSYTKQSAKTRRPSGSPASSKKRS